MLLLPVLFAAFSYVHWELRNSFHSSLREQSKAVRCSCISSLLHCSLGSLNLWTFSAVKGTWHFILNIVNKWKNKTVQTSAKVLRGYQLSSWQQMRLHLVVCCEYLFQNRSRTLIFPWDVITKEGKMCPQRQKLDVLSIERCPFF